MVERVLTGIEGLDAVLHGGIPEKSLVLVCGVPGTGKSILCAQALYSNALSGKKCLFLNLEQNAGKLERQMQQFGWNLADVKKNLKIVSVDSFEPETIGYILGEIKNAKYDLIALDSLDSVYSIPAEMELFGKKGKGVSLFSALGVSGFGRLKLKEIFRALAQSSATVFLTSERVENAPGLSRDTISEFLCDAIILMTYSGIARESNRTIEIRKNRLSDFDEAISPMEITSKGIVVRPLGEKD